MSSRGEPQFSVGLNPSLNTIEFSILNFNGDIQTLAWQKPEVRDSPTFSKIQLILQLMQIGFIEYF